MLENIKNTIYQNLNALFALAVVDQMAGDIPAFREKLKTIAGIAEMLGIETEITSISMNIKTGETARENAS